MKKYFHGIHHRKSKASFQHYFCATGAVLSSFQVVSSAAIWAQIWPDATMQYYHFYFTDT